MNEIKRTIENLLRVKLLVDEQMIKNGKCSKGPDWFGWDLITHIDEAMEYMQYGFDVDALQELSEALLCVIECEVKDETQLEHLEGHS